LTRVRRGSEWWKRILFCTASGCWEWLGAPRNGYGALTVGGKTQYAHRLVYELLRGPMAAGLVIDHLCRNTMCCNPMHLEPVTRGENVRRGSAPGVTSVRFAAETHCMKGHKRTPDNTTLTAVGGRRCRVCARARLRLWRSRKGNSI
jgi:hypothetical protein